MNELSSYLRRTLCEAWRNGYGEEARRAAIVAPLLTLIGFAAAWFFPQLTDHVMGVLEQAIDSAGLSSVTETRDMAAAIFANNLTAAFSAILWGLVPFAYLAAFPLGFNFFLIGALGAYYVRSGSSLGVYLVGILPHGVFELPALVLFCAAGLYLCSRVTARVRGDKEVRILRTLRGAWGGWSYKTSRPKPKNQTAPPHKPLRASCLSYWFRRINRRSQLRERCRPLHKGSSSRRS